MAGKSFIGKKYAAVVLLMLLMLQAKMLQAKLSDEILQRQYDEAIFVISNFSGVDANLTENRTIPDLLNQNIGGFRLYVDWDKQQHQLVVRKPGGITFPFRQTLLEIKANLDKNTERIFTLFLDFSTNVNEISDAFQETGLEQLIYNYDAKEGWPNFRSMIENNKRLVVFSMQEHRNSPEWMLYVWNVAVEPYFSLWEAPVFKGEFLKGDPKNSLLIYNDYNFSEKSEAERNTRYETSLNPYLIEHVKNTWLNTGKTPNFVMLDRYELWVQGVLSYVRGFKTIKGTVTYNTQTLDYVNWVQTGSLTSGKYCFPVGPGEKMVLTPQSPGYKFTPESVTFDEPTQNIVQHFIASPLNITDNLEGYYTFAKELRDYSVNQFNGESFNVRFGSDSSRTDVAYFSQNSYVVLPGAEAFKIRDHDFSVAAWVRIKEYLPGKRDYCILGTKTSTYQQGIHLLIRDRKPYFGFYNNDLQGKTTLEAGQWYHLVWRYNKLSGEQAIFLNGKLDSRSLGHPAYKGRDNLYLGVAGFNRNSYMVGEIDDLTIWSRGLSEEEVWQLSKEIIEIVPIKNVFILYPVISWTIISVIAIALMVFIARRVKKMTRKSPSLAERIRTVEHSAVEKPESNYIQFFGDFKVLDKNGNEITNLFTPKLKQLFMVIMLFSQKNRDGISTQELTDILWQGHSSQSAKNSRGVTIRKLRLILESLDTVKINFHVDRWSMSFGGSVYCDYLECLKLLKRDKIHDADFGLNFYNIIQEGDLFKGDSFDWLDDFKGFISNNIVDILIKFISELSIDNDKDLILKLADRILISDPVNDQALGYKLKILVKQNNYNLARFTFDRFCTLYEEMYGEKFQAKFDELIA